MRNKMAKSKQNIKAELEFLSKDELIKLIQSMSKFSKDAELYLDYFVYQDDAKIQDHYKNILAKQLYPSRGKPKVADAKKTYIEFLKLKTNDMSKIELLLFLSYGLHLEVVHFQRDNQSKYRAVTKYLVELLDLLKENLLLKAYEQQILNFIDLAYTSSVNYQFELFEIYNHYFNTSLELEYYNLQNERFFINKLKSTFYK